MEVCYAAGPSPANGSRPHRLPGKFERNVNWRPHSGLADARRNCASQTELDCGGARAAARTTPQRVCEHRGSPSKHRWQTRWAPLRRQRYISNGGASADRGPRDPDGRCRRRRDRPVGAARWRRRAVRRIHRPAELAYEPSGYNHARGRVRTPWNPDFVAGGSSSGSAAAVASGSVVVALGSDTAGSLRIPAHCCGVTAWKPTHGLVPCVGAMPLAPSLDTIGLLARSTSDMRDAIHTLIGDDQPRADGSIERVAAIADCFDAAEPEVRRACLQGVDSIEASGARMGRRTSLGEIEAIGGHALVVLQAQAARVHRARIEDPDIPVLLRKRLAKGFAIDDATLAASLSARETLAREFTARVFGAADAIVLPVMAIRVPRAVETD